MPFDLKNVHSFLYVLYDNFCTHKATTASACTKECSLLKYVIMHKGCLERAAEGQAGASRCMGTVPREDIPCFQPQDIYVKGALFALKLS